VLAGMAVTLLIALVASIVVDGCYRGMARKQPVNNLFQEMAETIINNNGELMGYGRGLMVN
jgi:hypothetical protein